MDWVTHHAKALTAVAGAIVLLMAIGAWVQAADSSHAKVRSHAEIIQSLTKIVENQEKQREKEEALEEQKRAIEECLRTSPPELASRCF